MRERYLEIIFYLAITIISSIAVFYGCKLCRDNHFEVPGTVIGKSETVIGHRKSSRISSEWWLAVKPDNDRYKPYAVCVNFATFSSYNVGSHVSFKVMSCKVDPNGHDDGLSLALFIFGCIGCMFGLTLFIKSFRDIISNKKYDHY